DFSHISFRGSNLAIHPNNVVVFARLSAYQVLKHASMSSVTVELGHDVDVPTAVTACKSRISRLRLRVRSHLLSDAQAQLVKPAASSYQTLSVRSRVKSPAIGFDHAQHSVEIARLKEVNGGAFEREEGISEVSVVGNSSVAPFHARSFQSFA